MSSPYGPPGGPRQRGGEQVPGSPPWGDQPYPSGPWSPGSGPQPGPVNHGQPGQPLGQPYGAPPTQPAPMPPGQPSGHPQSGYSQPGYPPSSGPPGQYGYGPQQPGGFGDPAVQGKRRKRSPWPWALGGLGVLALAVVLFLGFVTPGWFYRTVFDSAAMEKGVTRILQDVYGVQGVESVSCPSGQPVTGGSTFTCRVTVQGQSRSVEITVQDAEGTYEVSRLR